MIVSNISKFLSLLSKKQIFKVSGLLLLLLIGMFLEIIGIGILLPTLEIISDPKVFYSNKYFSAVVDYFNLTNSNQISNYLLISVIFIYFFKTLFLVYLTYKQNKFIYNLNASLSSRLFNKYIASPYSFHVNRNSSELIKILEKDMNYLNPFAMSVLSLITEFFLCLSILITIIVIEPFGAISIGIGFFILSFIFYSFTKIKLKFWGIKRSNLEAESSKIILEGLNGIRDLKLNNVEEYFSKKLTLNKNSLATVTANHNTFNLLPRYYLEFTSVFIITCFIIYMVLSNQPLSSLITIIGIFVAAVFKMIPSINKILSSLQNFKFYSSSMDLIINELKLNDEKVNKLNSQTKKKLSLKNNIKVDKLCFRYNETEDWILHNISFQVNKGEMVGFVGESGSGKSTLIDILTGLQEPHSGSIKIDNNDIRKDISMWQNTVGYVSQNVYLRDSSILENIAFGIPVNKINIKKAMAAIDLAQLTEKVKSLANGINSNIGESGVLLSGGQKQRLGIARALYNNPDILIFDESTSSLDSNTENEFIESIRKLKGLKTILIVAHRLSSLKHCDTIYKIDNKTIQKYKIN